MHAYERTGRLAGLLAVLCLLGGLAKPAMAQEPLAKKAKTQIAPVLAIAPNLVGRGQTTSVFASIVNANPSSASTLETGDEFAIVFDPAGGTVTDVDRAVFASAGLSPSDFEATVESPGRVTIVYRGVPVPLPPGAVIGVKLRLLARMTNGTASVVLQSPQDRRRFGGGVSPFAAIAVGDVAEPGDGSAGPQGPEGPKGDPGPAGPGGPVGPVGPQGPAGPQGVDGLAGPQGTAGPQGPAGSQGPVGPQGSAGAQGPAGAAGPQGSPGAMGPQGVAGPAGPAGPKGNTGPQGPAGGLLGARAFFSSGTFEVPPGVTRIMVELWGGGGGGGGGGGSSSVFGNVGYGGGSGHCGTYTRSMLEVTPGEILTVTIAGTAPGGAPGASGMPGEWTRILRVNDQIAFATGGNGGGPGSTSEPGVLGSQGQLDPMAGISTGIVGTAETGYFEGIYVGTPFVCPVAGGLQYTDGGAGYQPSLAIPGTMVPPANRSMGGRGGDGLFPGTNGPCGNLAAHQQTGINSGSQGQQGYAMISW